jgi:hypothetical protein
MRGKLGCAIIATTSPRAEKGTCVALRAAFVKDR